MSFDLWAQITRGRERHCFTRKLDRVARSLDNHWFATKKKLRSVLPRLRKACPLLQILSLDPAKLALRKTKCLTPRTVPRDGQPSRAISGDTKNVTPSLPMPNISDWDDDVAQ